MTFLKAVNSTPSIREHLKKGLQALKRAGRSQVKCDGRCLRGSVDIDSAVRHLHPNDARWDYAVGVGRARQQDSVVWLEVHPASSSHVDEVLAKLRWLRHWLGGLQNWFDWPAFSVGLLAVRSRLAAPRLRGKGSPK